MKNINISINFTAIACILIAAIAVGGLLMINREIPVYGATATITPRDYPFWVLLALVFLVVFKFIQAINKAKDYKFPVLAIARLGSLIITMVVGLFVLSAYGFLISAAIISVASAFLFGERKLLTGFLPLIVIVLAVFYLTVKWLNIPLPGL